MKNVKGFTLVEILIAVSIIITSTTVVLAILTSSFRTSNKTTSIDTVRQNGNSAINQLGRMIQFASGFNGVSEDGSDYIFDCSPPPENKCNRDFYYIKLVYSNEEKIIFCSDDWVMINGNSLFDSNKISVVAGSCKFTFSRTSSADTPVIGINFRLRSASTVSPILPEKNTTINFSTSIKMRNL